MMTLCVVPDLGTRGHYVLHEWMELHKGQSQKNRKEQGEGKGKRLNLNERKGSKSRNF